MRAAGANYRFWRWRGCDGDVSRIDQPSISQHGQGRKPARFQAAASDDIAYRQNNGLGGVARRSPDMKLAESQSQAMASLNKLDNDVKAPWARRLNASGYRDARGGILCKESHPGVKHFPAGATRTRTGEIC